MRFAVRLVAPWIGLLASPDIVEVRTINSCVPVSRLMKTTSGWKPTPVMPRLSAPLPVYEPVAIASAAGVIAMTMTATATFAVVIDRCAAMQQPLRRQGTFLKRMVRTPMDQIDVIARSLDT